MLFLATSMGIPFHEVRKWSSAEISLLIAYYREEPWASARADIHNAMQLQQHAEMHRDKSNRKEPFTLRDFWPFNKDVKAVPLQSKMRGLFGRKK